MTLTELVYSVLETRDANKDGEIWVQCPFCGDDKYRMGLNLNTGQAHCFRGSCEWKTRDKAYLFRELSKRFGIHEELDAEELQVKHKSHPKGPVSPSKIKLPEYYEAPWTDVTEEIGRAAWKYVVDRGITVRQIKKHRLGFCAVGKYSWRIVIPVTCKGKMVGFTCRDFSGVGDPKYLNSEGLKTFYNIPSYYKETCVLSEGPIDALAIERACSYFDSLGRLGSGFTSVHRKILLNYREVILWPDPDKAGVDLCIKLANEFKHYIHAKYNIKISVVMPTDDDTDPGKLGETEEGLKEIERRIKHRVPWDDNVPLKLRAKVAFA